MVPFATNQNTGDTMALAVLLVRKPTPEDVAMLKKEKVPACGVAAFRDLYYRDPTPEEQAHIRLDMSNCWIIWS